MMCVVVLQKRLHVLASLKGDSQRSGIQAGANSN